jgi:hypothetical protein
MLNICNKKPRGVQSGADTHEAVDLQIFSGVSDELAKTNFRI